MKITRKWLENHDACVDAVEWVNDQQDKDEIALIEKAVRINHFDWANWYVVRRFNKRKRVMYAIFAAEKVLNLFEKKYPKDMRPREAIAVARAYLKKPSKVTKKTAWSAWSAARSAAGSAAESAGSAAWSAAESAAWSAGSARSGGERKLQKAIIKYGISLLK